MCDAKKWVWIWIEETGCSYHPICALLQVWTSREHLCRFPISPLNQLSTFKQILKKKEEGIEWSQTDFLPSPLICVCSKVEEQFHRHQRQNPTLLISFISNLFVSQIHSFNEPNLHYLIRPLYLEVMSEIWYNTFCYRDIFYQPLNNVGGSSSGSALAMHCWEFIKVFVYSQEPGIQDWCLVNLIMLLISELKWGSEAAEKHNPRKWKPRYTEAARLRPY